MTTTLQIWTNEERNAKYPHLAELYTPIPGESLEEAAYRIGRYHADDRASGDNHQAWQDAHDAYSIYTGERQFGGTAMHQEDLEAFRNAYRRGNEERLRERFAETNNAFYLHQIDKPTVEEEKRMTARSCSNNVKHGKPNSKRVQESREWLRKNGFPEEIVMK